MYVIQAKIHLFALQDPFMCFYDKFYIQITQKRAYKRNIRVIFVSIIPYSQYILIYYIDKSTKRGVTHKNLISPKPPHNCKPILLAF